MSLPMATLHAVLLAMAICLTPALVLILAALICDLCRHWLERDE
jgi:hypothetical protein